MGRRRKGRGGTSRNPDAGADENSGIFVRGARRRDFGDDHRGRGRDAEECWMDEEALVARAVSGDFIEWT